MRQGSVETSHHLFLECIVAQQVCFLCLRWMGILFVQHKDLKVHFENFHLVHLNTKQNLLWKGLWVTAVRGIWEQRNQVIFKQGKPDAEEIFHRAQLNSWLWLKNRVHNFNFSFSNWILNPELCVKSYR